MAVNRITKAVEKNFDVNKYFSKKKKHLLSYDLSAAVDWITQGLVSYLIFWAGNSEVLICEFGVHFTYPMHYQIVNLYSFIEDWALSFHFKAVNFMW